MTATARNTAAGRRRQSINTRAEQRVDKELNAELRKVRGKEGMLLRVAEAALSEPSGAVRRVIYPVVGGEKTLKALAAEAAANEARYKARVRTVLRSSYSAHWRRMLSPLLGALELKCNNTAYRPVMDAIDLLKRYLEQPLKEGAFFDLAESVPLAGGGARAVAGGGGGRQGPCRARPVRAVRAGGASGCGAAPGDLGGGGEPVA
ncbi:hypothetical protein ACFVRD_45445 [Streptomyces sp. NPDC057908]|uniref:hypothetical protein n=1 Tax=Streptomyces sp. NPDC057908 TaxID=3346276 RepID=UPI0036F0FCC6